MIVMIIKTTKIKKKGSKQRGSKRWWSKQRWSIKIMIKTITFKKMMGVALLVVNLQIVNWNWTHITSILKISHQNTSSKKVQLVPAFWNSFKIVLLGTISHEQYLHWRHWGKQNDSHSMSISSSCQLSTSKLFRKWVQMGTKRWS